MGTTGDPADWAAERAARTRQARAARRAATGETGSALMNRWNTAEPDPGQMAVLGHETPAGFEFCIERDGVAYTIIVTRDRDT